MGRYIGLEREAPGLRHPHLALRAGQVAATLPHDLPGAPAAGQVVRGPLRTDPLAVRSVLELTPRPVLLGVPVARHDLDQRLLVRVVLG
ncbi:MAG: hypothetical protein GY937_07815 [bacterium]|nr:hypothetical protein [bacterium]